MWDAVFRTDDLPKADRFDSWYQLVGGPTVPVIAHTEHPAEFHAVTRRLDLDSMRAYSLSGSPAVRGNRTPKLVRQSDPEFFSLAHLVRGTSRFAQDDWAQTYRAGDMMFYDSSHPFSCWMGDDRDGGTWHHIQVQFPRVLLPQPDLVNRLIGKRLSNQGGVRTLVAGYLREMVNLSAEYRPEDRAGLLTVTLNLITALLTHEVEPERPWDPDVQRTRILDFMRRHLADPNFRTEVPVELTISGGGGDERAWEQFYHWLRNDVDVVRSATISTAGSRGAGHMGAFEVISMSLGTVTGLANLGIAWANFLRARKNTPPFTINVSGTLSDEQLDMLRKLNLPLDPPMSTGDA